MDLTCLVAAFLFLLGQGLYIVYGFVSLNATKDALLSMSSGSASTFMDLDPEFIQELWAVDRKWEWLQIASYLINAMAWVVFSIPVLQLCWILSLGGRRAIATHTTMAVLCVVGSFTEFLSLLFMIGMSNATAWATKNLNLSTWTDTSIGTDMIGWRVLELNIYMYSGMVLWVDTFEWFAMFVILLLAYVSTRRLMTTEGNNNISFAFGKVWAHLGLFISLMSLIEFGIKTIGTLTWGPIGLIAALLSIANRLILFPLWLCLLSKQLSVAANSVEITKSHNNISTPSITINSDSNNGQSNNGEPLDMVEGNPFTENKEMF